MNARTRRQPSRDRCREKGFQRRDRTRKNRLRGVLQCLDQILKRKLDDLIDDLRDRIAVPGRWRCRRWWCLALVLVVKRMQYALASAATLRELRPRDNTINLKGR